MASAMAFCSVHMKSRTVKNLMEDGVGGMRCLPGSECRAGEPKNLKRSAEDAFGLMNPLMMLMGGVPMGVGQMGGVQKRARGDASEALEFCSIHGKKRSGNCLVDDGSGGKMCSPGMTCQVGAERANAGGGLEFCSVHGKKRRAQCLVDDGSGGMMCAPGQTCQIGAEKGEVAGEPEYCSIHEKLRSANCLVDDGSGGKMCAPGLTCQIGSEPGEPNETYMCSIHGKKRSAKCLILDESGSMRCAPGFECQVNGAGGGCGLKGGLKRSAGAGAGMMMPAGAGTVMPPGMTMVPTALLMQLAQLKAKETSAGGKGNMGGKSWATWS